MTCTTYCGRFAPSPTGSLHFGSLVAAAASYLEAKRRKGSWIVRIEDVDETRTVPGAADSILKELERLGLLWDGSVLWQSSRKDHYNAALHTLERQSYTFPCACSRREVGGSIYPGTCRGGIPPGRSARSIRMRAQGTVKFLDSIQGQVEQDVGKEVGDFVLRRTDGLHAYHLAVVVDDHQQGVTQVLRGADLLSSTPAQLLLYAALQWPAPSYAHVPVALNARGLKLSKQTRAPPTSSYLAPELVARALTFLGHPPPPHVAEMPPDVQWRWAVEHWELDNVPKVLSNECDEAYLRLQ